jgi:hypothetical protein
MRPRNDLTVKKHSGEAPGSMRFRAVRGVQSSETLGRHQSGIAASEDHLSPSTQVQRAKLMPFAFSSR